MPIRIKPSGWTVAGAVALVSIVVAAVVDFDPSSAEALTAALVLIALAWWAHSWRRLWLDERGNGRVA